MVGQITYAMRQINYPSKKIEFFYVVEESDLQTYKALRKALSEALADGIVNEKILVVPDGIPRTKPRACNYALAHASGDLLVFMTLKTYLIKTNCALPLLNLLDMRISTIKDLLACKPH
jgi:cellulose synthase/poly-beta-1,6-N-acetylglucosamine synthase-like glycosyltransferase